MPCPTTTQDSDVYKNICRVNIRWLKWCIFPAAFAHLSCVIAGNGQIFAPTLVNTLSISAQHTFVWYISLWKRCETRDICRRILSYTVLPWLWYLLRNPPGRLDLLKHAVACIACILPGCFEREWWPPQSYNTKILCSTLYLDFQIRAERKLCQWKKNCYTLYQEAFGSCRFNRIGSAVVIFLDRKFSYSWYSSEEDSYWNFLSITRNRRSIIQHTIYAPFAQ